MYAQLLKNDKQFDEAAAVFQVIGDHSQAGQCLRKAHRFEEAVRELEALPSMSERDYYNRAFCLVMLGEYERALADYNSILGADPDNVHALLNRGICLEKLGRTDESRRDFERLLEIDPDNEEARRCLGQ